MSIHPAIPFPFKASGVIVELPVGLAEVPGQTVGVHRQQASYSDVDVGGTAGRSGLEPMCRSSAEMLMTCEGYIHPCAGAHALHMRGTRET
jgi:hypothetical protein